MKLPSFSSVCLAFGVLACATATSCASDFGKTPNPPRLVVTIDANAKVGAPGDGALPLSVGTPIPFRVTVQAFAPSGAVDTTFNRYVRMSSKPGAIDPLTGPDTDGRNVLLRNGQSVAFDVNVSNAYGISYIVADDLGYVPADPLRQPPPKCANGLDDDGDGLIDFPADPGCAFANDDSEEGGTFSEGASAPIYFKLPRIADARGLRCDPTLGCSGNGATPYPRQQILLDTGFQDDNTFKFDTVVTRISANGFYVQDIGDPRGTPPGSAGYTSLFAFNFNAPPQMRTCDRVRNLAGTAAEFFGFTQLSYPTWALEDWDPAQRPCLVPTPLRLDRTLLGSAPDLLKVSAGYVRVETAPDGSQKVKVTPNFGPGDIQKNAAGAYVATPEASNCDFDHNGSITFAAGNPENDCNTACSADATCTEWSNWITRSTFRLTVSDSNGGLAVVQADATAAAGFDPVASKGQTLRNFAGTLTFFSGGAQFTIEARCKDDVISSLTDAPFGSDNTCTTDDQCSEKAGLPPGFKCTTLLGTGAPKACRRQDPMAPDPHACAENAQCDPPPLACVFPRTFIDNNPQ